MFIGKRKNGYYFVEYLDQSTQTLKRVSTGTKVKKEALKFLSEFKPTKKITTKEKAITIEIFKEEYLTFIENTYSKNYLRSVELSFKMLTNEVGEILLNKIDPRLAQQFISQTHKRTSHGAELYLRTLKAAFNRALEWGYIEENPFKRIKLSRGKKLFPVFITKEELETIISHTVKMELKNIFITAFYTGMRLSEITNLKWRSVNLEEKLIVVQNDSSFTTKSKKDRIIPISDQLLKTLEEIQNKRDTKDDYVFLNERDIRFNADYITKMFKKAVIKAKINNKVHFHSLRHSFASNLVQKGVSIYVVKELLGHESITTTQIYSHLQKSNLFDAVKLL